MVIVGSGPAGATVARELANGGREVALIDKGRWHRWPIGRFASIGTVTKLVRSKQGGIMGRAITAGGSSVVFNGNAYEPPNWLTSKFGIDISSETEETRKELNIKALPQSFYAEWKATLRLVEAAGELDIALVPQQKFIDVDKCDPMCDDCMLGCKRGAKWTAREYIKQAQDNGARVVLDSEVRQVIIEDGAARGVKLDGKVGANEIRADKVVLSAGGIGTPMILQRSGIDAETGFFIDPMNVVMGVGKERGTTREMTFSFASDEFVESEGFLVGNVGALTVLGSQLMGSDRLRALVRAPYLSRVMGMFTKIGDKPGGRVHADGTIEKPYSEQDRARFRKGTETCKNILIKAGVSPDSICVAKDIGGHPGGTAAIGKVVDTDLQAYDVKNLYVCDASVFPRSPGRPPTLTLIALAKYLARTL